MGGHWLEYAGSCIFVSMALITDADQPQLLIIHQLAGEIWPEVFASILSPEQITYMLNWMYSLPALELQMQEGHHFLLVKEGEDFVGYASYAIDPAHGIAWLHKIYLKADKRGAGLGKALIAEVIERTRNIGARVLHLNVNRHNPAVGFYQKLGFRIIRKEDKAIGQGFFMNDYVMELPLSR
jgi:ribosomal protein S18 acetylase RimI-like enzyme